MTVQQRKKGGDGLIITAASFKGGQAKTTTAAHLAALLNEKATALLVKEIGFPFPGVTALPRKNN